MSNVLVPGAPGPEQQDAPLTEAERKLLVRLFSDPTYFPVEFRTWIRTYLESSDIRLPSSAIVGGNQPKVNLPAGTVLPFAGATIPQNTLLCDGQTLLRDDYDLLFQAIGTLYGAPSGTQFQVPDLRDRALYGAGSVVGLAATDGRVLGSRGGPIHRHYFAQTSDGAGGHSHGVSATGDTSDPGNHDHGPASGAFILSGSGAQNAGSGSAWYSAGGFNSRTGGAGAHTHSVSVSGGTDGVGDHSHWVEGDTSGGYDYDKPAYAGINYIIATGKNV